MVLTTIVTIAVMVLCCTIQSIESMSAVGLDSLNDWPAGGMTNGRIWDIGATWNTIHQVMIATIVVDFNVNDEFMIMANVSLFICHHGFQHHRHSYNFIYNYA